MNRPCRMMNEALTARLRMMTFLWDELARCGSVALFHEQFMEELDALRRFQECFPQGDPAPLVGLLEAKVMREFRLRFSKEEIQRFRARLNRMN
ncbi:MAG: hypothetical protein EOP86_09360 [Verrucomicrobiaceae bacterium]|nr:MAG: hypothetical protein EOP86_09360 [Verrucomicrobiaceae bacterium]